MKYALYNFWRSSSSWRVRAALNLKGLEWEYRVVNLTEGGQWSAEHVGRNPTGHVPVLALTQDDGTTHEMGQSLPIIEFLDERHPEPPLLPRDPFLRAHCRQLAETVNSSIQPYQNLITLKALREIGADESAWLKHFLGKGLAALEALTARHAGRYSVGDTPSLADLCLVPQIYSARRFHVDLSPYPLLVRVDAACMELAAFADAHPDRQPDAPAVTPG